MSCETESLFCIAGVESFYGNGILQIKLTSFRGNTMQYILFHCGRGILHNVSRFTDNNNFMYFFILISSLLSHLSSITKNLDSCLCWLKTWLNF